MANKKIDRQKMNVAISHRLRALDLGNNQVNILDRSNHQGTHIQIGNFIEEGKVKCVTFTSFLESNNMSWNKVKREHIDKNDFFIVGILDQEKDYKEEYICYYVFDREGISSLVEMKGNSEKTLKSKDKETYLHFGLPYISEELIEQCDEGMNLPKKFVEYGDYFKYIDAFSLISNSLVSNR